MTRPAGRSLSIAVTSLCWPVRTNARFLVNALENPDFAAGDVDTGLIAREAETLTPSGEPSQEAWSWVAHMVFAASRGGTVERQI